MKEKIENLIQQYRESRVEVWSLLEELSQVDNSKLDYKEIDSLNESILRYEDEYYIYGNVITDLENLL